MTAMNCRKEKINPLEAGVEAFRGPLQAGWVASEGL